MDKVRGSMEALSAMQLTTEMEGLDVQSKTLLRSIETYYECFAVEAEWEEQ